MALFYPHQVPNTAVKNDKNKNYCSKKNYTKKEKYTYEVGLTQANQEEGEEEEEVLLTNIMTKGVK